jgi:hypothetical protein
MEKQTSLITLDDYWMGRDKIAPPTDQLRANAADLVERVNHLLSMYYAEVPAASATRVTSGYRPPAINARVGGALRSNHRICKAVDLSDPDGGLDEWCEESVHYLVSYGLWLEHPDYTPGWCHLQSIGPRSGRRIFYP